MSRLSTLFAFLLAFVLGHAPVRSLHAESLALVALTEHAATKNDAARPNDASDDSQPSEPFLAFESSSDEVEESDEGLGSDDGRFACDVGKLRALRVARANHDVAPRPPVRGDAYDASRPLDALLASRSPRAPPVG